ncbi:hypothetical protein BI364_05335 [Acidihalobacter yilgarnensis]|uniref:Thiol:disulfide interchange protein n=1 Tax=Acidihalobacter yilgarnensis TaxID=2819280 RepID=A0A1D8ILY2_9GAMM|nr:thioredoxin fold domain-containing protein [Acidihalobacter yilgarnensis]AOU97473.1 hypothetical protein BI364_05335 [Acidihalobacter yilgarnensis]
MPFLQKPYALFAAFLLIAGLVASPAHAASGNPAISLLKDVHKAVQITEGKGAKTLYIFFDPNCPYCHKLFEELRPYVKRDEVTVHWITVGILTSTSPGKAAAILQSKDRLKAFYQSEHDWNFGDTPGGGIAPLQNPSAKTRHELDINNGLLADHGLNGVPVTLFATTDGSAFYFEGTPPPDKLAEILQYVK